MTDAPLELTSAQRRHPRHWRHILAALLAFALGSIAINFTATRASNGTAIQDGFASGALETITPVDLAPWWLVARAQLDCQQLMPLVSGNLTVGAAIARPQFALADRKVNACVLLASAVERKRLSGNMREVSRRDGFHTAGSLTLPAMAMLGVAATRWASALILLGATACGLWFICTAPAMGGRRDRIAATACMMGAAAFILAIPGSLTAIPTIALLVVSLVGILIALRKHGAAPDSLYVAAPFMAAALVSLDPAGGSVPVGLGCMMLLARMVAPTAADRPVVLRTAVLYMLTVLLCWFTYAALVGVTSGWNYAALVLRDQLMDTREAGRIGDFIAGATGTYKWLSGENLLGPLGAFDLLFTVLFGLMIYAAVEPLHPRAGRLEPLMTALLAVAPVVLWALLYPGDWRRAEEQYVLPLMWLIAIAMAGPFVLLIEFARRVARRRPASPAPAKATSVA
ncbi:MAG: hypothetical protein V4533_10675 [Pseudomonadota bacterium]|tara:strand:+ start:11720 stop:13090 length:1371 start_codon:yes stop_codon:yes gene_type:complete